MAIHEYPIVEMLHMRLVKLVKTYGAQNAAARAIGIPPSLVNRYLRGNGFPNGKTISKIDRVYLRIVAYENFEVQVRKPKRKAHVHQTVNRDEKLNTAPDQV